MGRTLITSFFVAVAWASAASSALAADLCVGGAGCFATVQAAVDAAQDGDTVRIGPGRFAGGITVDKGVQLVGVSSDATIIEGGGPVITIGEPFAADQPTVSISRVTITDGLNDSDGIAAGGGVRIEFAGPGASGPTVTISDSVITRNRATPSGLIPPGGFCGPTPCAVAWGGGIDNSGTLTLTNTRVTDNVAGATPTDSSDATIAQGGGIRNHPGSTLTLRHTVVSGNRAAATLPNGQFADGGGIADNGVLTIEESVVSDNTAEVSSSVSSTFPFDVQQIANAGGLYLTGSAMITGSTISGNSVRSSNAAGDALAVAGGIDGDGSLVLRHSRVVRNEVIVTVPPFSGSTAVAANGGLEGQGVSTVRDSAISGNIVTAHSVSGFAIAAAGGLGNTGQTTLERTHVIGNSAAADGAGGLAQGGGIANFSLGGPDPELTLTDSVVTANSLSASPGIELQGGSLFTAFPVTLIRTVVAGNHPDPCFGC